MSYLLCRLAPLLQQGKSVGGPEAMQQALDKLQTLDHLRSDALSDDTISLLGQNMDLTAPRGKKVTRIHDCAASNAALLMQRKDIDLEAAAQECADDLQRDPATAHLGQHFMRQDTNIAAPKKAKTTVTASITY
jgi:hypothetical protein